MEMQSNKRIRQGGILALELPCLSMPTRRYPNCQSWFLMTKKSRLKIKSMTLPSRISAHARVKMRITKSNSLGGVSNREWLASTALVDVQILITTTIQAKNYRVQIISKTLDPKIRHQQSTAKNKSNKMSKSHRQTMMLS